MRFLAWMQPVGYLAAGLGFLAAVAGWSTVLVVAALAGGYLLLACEWLLRRRAARPSGSADRRAAS